MKYFSIIMAAAALVSTGSAAQINFYNDNNCGNYIGEAHPDYDQTVGGPPGGFSALWVQPVQCFDTCTHMYICGDSNCNSKQKVNVGQCVHFNTGVWGQTGCGCV